jgi:hypothetical protein
VGVPVEAIGARVVAGAVALATMLGNGVPDVVTRRPAPDVWSPLEYGGHVRDG